MSTNSSQDGNKQAGGNKEAHAVKAPSFIYIGPSVPGGVLGRFTIFRGGKPEHLKELFESCPALDKLLIPVEKLSELLERLSKPGTPLHTWYGQAVDFIQKGAK